MCRSFRPVRKSWSWTPVVLPPRDPLCLLETLVITSTLSKFPPWVSDCWKEVRNEIKMMNKTINIKRLFELFINRACMHSFNQVITCFIDLLSVNFALSDSASLHSRGPGLSHSTLLCGRPLCGHYDCRGGGHYVCAKN